MAEKTLRLPLLGTLNSRQENLKNNFIANAFIEKNNKAAYVSKRPGLSFLSQGAGSSNGIYFYNDKIYKWDISLPNNAPLTLNIWSPNVTYSIGSSAYSYNNAHNGVINWTAVTPVKGVPPASPAWNLPVGTGWTLINSINTGILPLTSIYQNGTRNFFSFNNGVGTGGNWQLYYTDNLLNTSLTFSNSISELAQMAPFTTKVGSAYWMFNSNLSGVFTYTVSNSPYSSWANAVQVLTGAVDWYNSGYNIEFGGYIYGFPNGNISNGLTRINTTTFRDDDPFAPVGLPSGFGTASNFFKDSSNFYFFVLGNSPTPKIYKSTNGINWSLFYTFLENGQIINYTFANSKIYLMFSTHGVGAIPDRLLTISDNGSIDSYVVVDGISTISTGIDSLNWTGTKLRYITTKLVVSNYIIEVWESP